MPRPFGYRQTAETKRKIAEAHISHGHTIAPQGSAERRTYSIWRGIRKRCNNPSEPAYVNYGGRDIQVCAEWSTYDQFVADMGLCPDGASIDRINNDGDYCRENCRWATRQEQARNRRSNRLLMIDGEEKTLAEWAVLSGLNSSTIRMRINYNGGRVDRSILDPVKKEKRGYLYA